MMQNKLPVSSRKGRDVINIYTDFQTFVAVWSAMSKKSMQGVQYTQFVLKGKGT